MALMMIATVLTQICLSAADVGQGGIYATPGAKSVVSPTLTRAAPNLPGIVGGGFHTRTTELFGNR